jgi:nucleotide-binding universal stress UspA family protein
MDTPRSGRVVVGVDNTLSGLHALRRAVAEARIRGIPLHAVRTWGPDAASSYPMLQNPHEHQVAAASQLVARAFADTMGGLPLDVDVEIVLVPDKAGPVLVRHAGDDDDLLVIGTGRRRRFWRRSSRTTRYCLARAACPVLVVPPPPLAGAGSTRALMRKLRRELDQLAGAGPGT